MKRIIDIILVFTGICSGIIYYLGKYKKMDFLQFPFLICMLFFGIIYFFDTYTLSEQNELTSYHVVRSVGILLVSVLLLLFKIIYNKSVF